MSLTRRHFLFSTSAAALAFAVDRSALAQIGHSQAPLPWEVTNMFTRDRPEKGREVRSAPAIAEPSAPPKSKASKASPSRAESTTAAPAATQVREERTVTNAPSATPMQRADELLRKMTIEEKAMQLSSVWPMALLGTEGPIRKQLDAQLKHGIGHVSALGLIGHKTPERVAKAVNATQRYLVTETRLKIPAIFHNEAMSGVVAPHFTAFPTPIGLAATWDPTAVEEMADLLRRQMRSVGLLQALAPVMDVARDARWGRVHETYGEDPYLVTAMSVAYTRGLQRQGPEQGRIGNREALPRLRGDRRRPEHGRDRGRRARALRRVRPSLRGRHPARRARDGDA